MAIEFKCSTCGKELFAQEQFAGMRTTCPGCQSKMPIPFPAIAPKVDATAAMDSSPAALSSAPATEPPAEAVLIDMEKVVLPTAASEATDATKRCPMCAEKIQAAARKCRFCGEILDEELKQGSAQFQQNAAVMAALINARRSDAIFRGASVLATMLTTGWLLKLTLDFIVLSTSPGLEMTFLAPWPVYMFNVLLIGGLFTLIRQMKTGPSHVFIAAAISIVVCMPLDICLGLPIPEHVLADFRKQENLKDLTMDGLVNSFIFLSGMIGTIISIPVWLTALKLALQERVANRLK